ncbi:MAG TPA: transketolase, partial [Patescibacteria group bacterium]|nr:transketolase [Patescibacteria group bacterium]
MANNVREIAKLIRYYSLTTTTVAGSGHPTSCLSAADLVAELFFGGHFKADLENPLFPNNDRFILSKGHAAPLLYATYAAAGKVSEDELMTLRHFDSGLEGHPTMNFRYTEAATGSLGQGLSIGVGMALAAKADNATYRTYVLMGDSETAEGSVWEAAEIASFYGLDNLIAIIDINRLGQRGETLYGTNTESYKKKFEAFGWSSVVIDGHNIIEITEAYEKARSMQGKPFVILARTLKGRGVSFIEDKEGWHGKPLSWEDLDKALAELGEVDKMLVGTVEPPESIHPRKVAHLPDQLPISEYKTGEAVSTRKAYGNALKNLEPLMDNMIVLDAEVSNSTFAETVKKQNPKKFYEMFIAEQNMVGTALGFATRGKVPFISTFAAFFSRAYDQIRMSQYSNSNIKFTGSHAGCSIGEDGASQMALEDLAMFRAVKGMTVLYPSDAVSTERLVFE